jgi:hypothetical protein
MVETTPLTAGPHEMARYSRRSFQPHGTDRLCVLMEKALGNWTLNSTKQTQRFLHKSLTDMMFREINGIDASARSATAVPIVCRPDESDTI